MFPRLYAILDFDCMAARSLKLLPVADELRAAGVNLIQYRNKQGSARALLQSASQLRELFPANGTVRILLNDRPDLALLAALDGVHVGQDDVSAEGARSILGVDRWVGVSTHNLSQVIEANETNCNYIAYGPIFPTATKENPDPIVGLAGLKEARAHTRKSLVAIGGITRQNCRSVLDAGADSVAVISDLLPVSGDSKNVGISARDIAEEFLSLLS
jgi:thiamine-phosphate pyrophosphorylase